MRTFAIVALVLASTPITRAADRRPAMGSHAPRSNAAIPGDRPDCPEKQSDGAQIVAPSDDFNPFYQKAVQTTGVPIVSSGQVCDRTLQVTSEIVSKMLSKRKDIEARMIGNPTFVAVFAVTESETMLPEEKDLAGKATAADPNMRFDAICGGGGIGTRPTAICERNLIGVKDPFYGKMSVMIHEFGHAIQNIGLDQPTLERIKTAYENAKSRGLFARADSGTSWMMSNVNEFFAEGTGTWFNAADPGNPADSPEETGRAHLKVYDPELYQILSEIYPDDDWSYPRR